MGYLWVIYGITMGQLWDIHKQVLREYIRSDKENIRINILKPQLVRGTVRFQ
jgi:hypothetical protein